mgnify:FL=1
MKPFSSKDITGYEKHQPKPSLRLIGVIVFVIGALISIPTFIIGLEQEGSWLISQIGIIMFCITIIATLVLDILFVAKVADWESANEESTLWSKVTMTINALFILFTTLFMLLIILSIETN